MAEPLFSPSWYRVAKLKPRLRGHARIHRHAYRDETWYILQDQASGRLYRFTPVAYQVIGLMDGNLTVQELWEKAAERFGDDAPTQGDMVRLLGQLHAADVLLCDVPPDTAELLRRFEKADRSWWRINLRSPLSLRFPLLDPERFLSRTAGIVRPFLSAWGFAVWLAVVGAAAVLAAMHWGELTEDLVDRVLSAKNLLVMWLVFPVVKALHEFGHGYAIKARGGEVHEMGIMLLVLTPVPYVDASASTAFRDKRSRIFVGAAGMMAELFVASLALFLWVCLQPGLARTAAYNAVLVAGVSTLLFNLNPLLRYDGYYILSDWAEIANLSQRSQAYLAYLFKRRLFGMRNAEPPYAGPGERPWFVVYAAASFIYRIFLYAAIILFIAGKFFLVGVLLAAWAFVSMVAVPAVKGAGFVLRSPALREKRVRALAVSGALVLAVLGLLFLAPFPCWTRAEGVVWVPEEALVRAGTAGFIDAVKAPPNGPVRKGDVLIACSDPMLPAGSRVLAARLQELTNRYRAALPTDRVAAEMIREAMGNARADLARADERVSELSIRSPADGLFVIPGAEDLPGRFLKQGDLVAYVLDIQKPTVRVVVTQSDVDLVRQRTRAIGVRLAERLTETLPAVMKREVPGGLERLPSTILGMAGGGQIPIDPRDAGGTKAFERLFQFDIELPRPDGDVYAGGRAYVRFDHGTEPLAFQWYRSVRRLFLKRFNV